jgi:hypothetical protein
MFVELQLKVEASFHTCHCPVWYLCREMVGLDVFVCCPTVPCCFPCAITRARWISFYHVLPLIGSDEQLHKAVFGLILPLIVFLVFLNCFDVLM